jgi:diacylglycerol O-acyltransferase / wax synthase
MSSIRLNALDAGFLYTESDAAPNHVGGLLEFRLPEGAPRDFLRRMMVDFRRHRTLTAPWNRRLKYAIKKHPAPVWIEDDAVDLEYHVRHTALPWPGGERELGELIGRLHSQPLDLSRPPWECTIIEGLEGNRFALFIKIHHALIDGVSGMRMLQRSMATDRARSLRMPPFWAAKPPNAKRPERALTEAPTFADVLTAAMQALRGQARTAPQLFAAFGKMLGRLGAPAGDGMVVPFTSPRSVLNGRVRAKRRFATQHFPIERLRTLAKAAGGTLNDVVLAMCGGALRRFLHERDSLPDQSLTAAIPVSVRPKDDQGSGNAISFVIASLGTDIADPAQRFAAIRTSVQHAKTHVQSLPKQAMEQYTLLLMAPTIVTLMTGIAGRVRPMYNVMVSNVPGPDKPLYFRGAEMVGCYPASVVTHGQALNITCQSYAGEMDFGITGCHATLPSLQRLAVYMADALDELERVFVPGARPARKAARRRAEPKAAATRATGKKAVPKARKAMPPKSRAKVAVAGRGA